MRFVETVFEVTQVFGMKLLLHMKQIYIPEHIPLLLRFAEDTLNGIYAYTEDNLSINGEVLAHTAQRDIS